MKYKRKTVVFFLSILLLGGTNMNAAAFLGFGNSAIWKEEVLLHDGTKIVVERWQSHGGRHEIGQPLPIKDHSITFTLPGRGKNIVWEDKYSKDLGGANFIILALHIKGDIPYVIATPTACQEYNKWGRPNPPYVIFKFDGKEWQRIALANLPLEFKEINLVIDTYNDEKKLLTEGLVSAEKVKKFNSRFLKYPHVDPVFMSIVREPLETGKNSASNVDCEVLIQYKCKGVHMGWAASGEFNRKYFEKMCK
ncbi:MAG: hypothetical protein V2B20_16645 [Pseudomonadota bacterium]